MISLEREIISSFQDGWFLAKYNCPRPVGVSSLAKIRQKGWDAYIGSIDYDRALENFWNKL